MLFPGHFPATTGFTAFNEAGLDTVVTFASDLAKTWQALAVELTDYSKRSVEHQTAMMEKLFAARSLEHALEVQTSHVKRTYDDYVQQVARLNGIFADLTKHAMKPVEGVLAPRQ